LCDVFFRKGEGKDGMNFVTKKLVRHHSNKCFYQNPSTNIEITSMIGQVVYVNVGVYLINVSFKVVNVYDLMFIIRAFSVFLQNNDLL